MAHRMEEVLEEISVISGGVGLSCYDYAFFTDCGHSRRVLNVLLGERYKVATEEAIRYVLGHYGKPPAPIDQNVIDRITQLPEAKGFLDWEQPQPSIKELRKEIGRPRITDDELLLRALFPQEHVEATIAAGPIENNYPRGDKPAMALIQELMNRNDLGYIQVQKGDFSLTLQKHIA